MAPGFSRISDSSSSNWVSMTTRSMAAPRDASPVSKRFCSMRARTASASFNLSTALLIALVSHPVRRKKQREVARIVCQDEPLLHGPLFDGSRRGQGGRTENPRPVLDCQRDRHGEHRKRGQKAHDTIISSGRRGSYRRGRNLHARLV